MVKILNVIQFDVTINLQMIFKMIHVIKGMHLVKF